jgi:hypothetical protein
MIQNHKNYNSICPLHNSQRLTYWANHSSIELNIYNSNISIRRYVVEEWEDKNYLLKNKISPQFYTDNFDIINYKFKYHDLLPFYIYNSSLIQ